MKRNILSLVLQLPLYIAIILIITSKYPFESNGAVGIPIIILWCVGFALYA